MICHIHTQREIILKILWLSGTNNQQAILKNYIRQRMQHNIFGLIMKGGRILKLILI